MDNSVPELLFNLNKFEEKRLLDKNRLKIILEQDQDLKVEIQLIKDQIDKLVKEGNEALNEVISKESDSEFLKEKKTILENVFQEENITWQKENSALEEIHSKVFKERKLFCDRVGEFVEQNGISIILRELDKVGEQTIPKSQPDADILQVETLAVKQLTEEVEELAKTKANLLDRLQNALEDKTNVIKKRNERDGYIRLQEDLRKCNQDTNLLETQCEAVKQEIARLDILLQQPPRAPTRTVSFNDNVIRTSARYSLQNDTWTREKNNQVIRNTELKDSVIPRREVVCDDPHHASYSDGYGVCPKIDPDDKAFTKACINSKASFKLQRPYENAAKKEFVPKLPSAMALKQIIQNQSYYKYNLEKKLPDLVNQPMAKVYTPPYGPPFDQHEEENNQM